VPFEKTFGLFSGAWFTPDRITMAPDEQVELAAAYAQALGGLHPVPIGPAQGPVQKEAFQLVEVGGQIFRLEAG
jgi:hypothetical protein